jgi:hypothetical protein
MIDWGQIPSSIMDASGSALVPAELRRLYEVREWRHAISILSNDFPKEWDDIVEVLTAFRFFKSDILAGGGAKSDISGKIDRAFYKRGWTEREFETKFSVDGLERDTRSHLIDCAKNRVGLEIEWNSKDQTFVRDVDSFRVLFDLRVLDVGVIVTRSDHLQQLFNELGIGKKYGASTTHMSTLLPRLEGAELLPQLEGVGAAGCPILVFGITKNLYDAGQ